MERAATDCRSFRLKWMCEGDRFIIVKNQPGRAVYSVFFYDRIHK
jgi:hypothetical protein